MGQAILHSRSRHAASTPISTNPGLFDPYRLQVYITIMPGVIKIMDLQLYTPPRPELAIIASSWLHGRVTRVLYMLRNHSSSTAEIIRPHGPQGRHTEVLGSHKHLLSLRQERKLVQYRLMARVVPQVREQMAFFDLCSWVPRDPCPMLAPVSPRRALAGPLQIQ